MKKLIKANDNEVTTVCENECSRCTCNAKKDVINVQVKELELKTHEGFTFTSINEDGITTNKRRVRGFEIVADNHRKHPDTEIQLPVRGDSRSAGYDIRIPNEVTIKAGEKQLIWTDIKAYMMEDEVLELHVRSSIGIKKGLILANITGIIDSSYYNNEDNDGNLGLCLINTTDKDITLESQERVCQGIFQKYLTVDDDLCLHSERIGGIGSSNR